MGAGELGQARGLIARALADGTRESASSSTTALDVGAGGDLVV